MPEATLEPLLKEKLPETVGPVLFRRLGGRYLLTNDWGNHYWLEAEDFSKYIGGTLEEETPLWHDLRTRGFLRNYLSFHELGGRWRQRTHYLQEGPGLHHIAVTRRNRNATPYTMKPQVELEDRKFDMTLAMARRLAKFVFDSPNSEITLELRGGDPMLNWDVSSFLIRHASSFAGSVKRKLQAAIVSPLSELDEEKIAFLAEHGVAVSVPLDGPKDLHDALRSEVEGGGTWEKTVAGIKALKKAGVACEAYFTLTRGALGRVDEIIEAYQSAGLDSIHVRSLWPVGDARARWDEISVSSDDSFAFYKELLDACLALEAKGTPFREKGAAVLLTKILQGTDPGAVENRLVYGGGLGEMAYDFDGDVYPSDEGRGYAEAEGDQLFRIGSADLGFKELISHSTVRALAVASDLGSQPLCSQCVYKPFCGVSPVFNVAAQGSLHGRNSTNDRCATYMGMFDSLFERLRDEKVKPIFERWSKTTELERGEPTPPFLSGGLL